MRNFHSIYASACTCLDGSHIVLDLQNDFLDPIKKLLCSSSSVEFKVSIKIHGVCNLFRYPFREHAFSIMCTYLCMYVRTYVLTHLCVHLKLFYVHMYLEIVDHQFKRHCFVLILVCCFTIICGTTTTFCFN